METCRKSLWRDVLWRWLYLLSGLSDGPMTESDDMSDLPLIQSSKFGNTLFPWLDDELFIYLHGDDGYYTRRALAETRFVAFLISAGIAVVGLIAIQSLL